MRCLNSNLAREPLPLTESVIPLSSPMKWLPGISLIGFLAIAGCQSGQSPIVPTEKNPIQPIIIQGTRNKVKIKQKWRTDVWLEGAIQNKQDQDNKLDVEIPLIP